MLSLRACKPIDCTTLVPAQTSTLKRNLFANALCFHPDKPLVAIGALEYVAVFDLLSGSRLGRIDVRSLPVEMSFSAEGSQLVVALQDWQICAISLSTWRSRILVPRRAKAEKGLDDCLLAVSSGPRPMVYFTKLGKEIVRYAYVNKTEMRDAKGRPVKDSKDTSWGSKLKLDTIKPILSLGYHPTDQQLLVLHADGVMRGYCPGAGQDVPAALFAISLHDPVGKVLPAKGTLEALPHPFMPGGMLLLQATRLGAINIMEQVGRNTPKVLLTTLITGWSAILGLGYHPSSQMIIAFGLTENGKVRSAAWKVFGSVNTPGLRLTAWKMEPTDLSPLLDLIQQSKPTSVPKWSAQGTTPNYQAASQVAALDAWGLPIAGAKPERGPKKTAAPTGPPSWMSMWAPAAAWSVEAPSSALLERQMGPLVSKIVVHRVLGTVACQLEPSYLVQTTPALLDQTMGALTDQELSMARRTASVPLLTLVQSEPHFFGWQGGQASIMHSPLSAWKPDVVSDRLALPCHLYYSSSGMVWKHSLATQKASPLLTLPSEASGGNVRHVRHMVVGRTSSAFLIFFEACGASDTAVDRWQWTLLLPSALESSSPALWFKGGKYGAFLGPDDAHFAVIEPTGNVAAVFVTADTTTPNATPLYTVNMDGASISNGSVACPLFPGPLCKVMPVYEEEEEEEDVLSEEEAEKLEEDMEDEDNKPKGPRRGLGVIVWQSADGHLVCAGMPFARSKSAPKAEGEEEEEEEGPMGVGQHMGKVDRQAALPLLPGEHVLQVAWQSLSTYDPVLPGDAVGAVLTCQRIMMVTADLRLHVSVSIRHGSPSALSHPVTSLLWVGPVLLYLTASGQVMQMPWNGKALPFCHVAPSQNNFLVGATPDSLLLLRATKTGAMEVVTRPASMLQPLVMGWASLGSCGLSGGSASLQAVRSALQSTMGKCDVSSVTPSLVWGLISACAWDIAAAVSNISRASSLDAYARLAANASAAQWGVVMQELAHEASQSLYHPSPPPKGSSLHSKLLAGAAGAAGHGQISKAVEMCKVAGEWRTAMALCVCQGDFASLFLITKSVKEGGASAAEVAEATTVATSLRSLYGSSSDPTPDYTLKLVDPEGTELLAATEWELGTGGEGLQAEAVPAATPSFLIAEGEVGPLPAMSTRLAAAYLGLDAEGTAKMAGSMSYPVARTIGASSHKASSEAALDMMSMSGSSLFNLGARPTDKTSEGAADPRALSRDFLSFGEGSVKSKGTGGEESSDEDLDLDDFGTAPGTGRKFKIQIKAKDSSATTAAGADLRSAMGNIKLGAPAGSTSFNSLGAASLPPRPPVHVAGGDFLDIFGGPPSYSSAATAPAMSPALLSGLSPALQVAGGASAPAPAMSPALQSGLSPALQVAAGASAAAPPAGGWGMSPALVAGGASAAAPPAGGRGMSSALQAGLSPALQMASAPQSSQQPIQATHTPAGPPRPPPAATPAQASAQAPAGPTSVQLYQQGVARMEAADWAKSSIAFECALEQLGKETKSPGHEQCVSFCAQYYAAVRLLATAATMGTSSKAAKLYRFLSALKLDDRHQLALTREAIQRNKAAGNNRFCGELLTGLITKLVGTAPDQYMAQLQAELDEIDRAGGSTNRDIPSDENLEDFAAIVASSSSKQEVEQIVNPLVTNM